MNPSEIRHIRTHLPAWYQKARRPMPWRETRNPYRIWVSEVMLQQTQVKTVLPYYHRFLGRFPDVTGLARADLQEVLKVWEGLGYYARARNLHRAAGEILACHDGRIPAGREEFMALPGVGDYIASAVLSIAFDRPLAVVDGNVKRVLARLREIDAPVNQAGSFRIFKETATRILPRREPGTFNQAMMELGATVCTPRNPACDDCPIHPACRARRTGNVDAYPKRLKRRRTPLHHVAVGVVFKKRRVLITRRKTDGFLGGLWEFPGGKLQKGEDPGHACIREIREEAGLQVKIESHLTTIRHAYTHFRIKMDVFRCRYVSGRVRLRGPVDHRWIPLSEIDRYPFPGANRKFIPLLRAA